MVRSYIVEKKGLNLLLSFSAFISCWSTVVSDEQVNYPEIHKIWPSLRMPNLFISRATAVEVENMNKNQTMVMSPSSPPRKTVVFPSPICVSILMAPCFMVQIDWRSSKSQLLGVVKDAIKEIPSVPVPRDKPMSKSHLFNLYTG